MIHALYGKLSYLGAHSQTWRSSQLQTLLNATSSDHSLEPPDSSLSEFERGLISLRTAVSFGLGSWGEDDL